MSTKPRTPEHFPRMKHRAAGRIAKQQRRERDRATFGSFWAALWDAFTSATQADFTLSPPPSECSCFPVEDPWTYYGAVEPGGAFEPNPDCPEHFPDTEAAPSRAASHIPRRKR